MGWPVGTLMVEACHLPRPPGGAGPARADLERGKTGRALDSGAMIRNPSLFVMIAVPQGGR
jgi:hypothetical protein